MAVALAGVEASGAPERTRMSIDYGVVLAAIVGTRVWVRRNRAALDLEQWCACAGNHVVVRVIPSEASRRRRPASVESLSVELAEVVLAGSGVPTRSADLRHD